MSPLGAASRPAGHRPTFRPRAGSDPVVVSVPAADPAGARAPNGLYLCYFGLREPLVQTQVLPYLRALTAAGVRMTLVTFEPAQPGWDPEAVADHAARLAGDGIAWHRRRYHQRPSVPATLFDVVVGARFVRRHARAGGVDVIHARSHIAAAMGALGTGGRTGVRSGRRRSRGHRERPRLLFDVRGFLPEEYVDAGLWPAGGWLFRAVKAAEAALLRRADGVVVLTEAARRILEPHLGRPGRPPTPLQVVPCCVDLERIPPPDPAARRAAKVRLGLGGRRVVLYVGSTTGFYLFDEMVDFVEALRRRDPSTFFSVLTQRDGPRVAERLARRGLYPGDCSVRCVAPDEVPGHAAAADVALSFVMPTFSKAASSPTKVAEYLAAGLPVVANRGVGDLDRQLGEDRVGVLVDELSPAGYRRAVAELEALAADPDLARRCRASAETRFDLSTVGGARYVDLYGRLLAGDGGPR